MKPTFIKFIFLFTVVWSASAQVSYSEKVQESTIEKEAYNLFFIDFWATWCGPCSYATTHINQIRDRFPNELYVATMSQEQPDLIRKYLKKHSNTLDVYADANNATFKNYNIKALPAGILFNAKGDMLWKGSPADFSARLLTRFLRSNRSKGKLETIFKEIKADKEEETVAYIPKKDFEIKSLGKSYSNDLVMKLGLTHTYFEGSLKSILSFSNEISVAQVVTENTDAYAIYLKNDLIRFLDNLVLNELDLKKNRKNEQKEALVFDVSEAKLWDSNQIDWSNNQLNYLITDEDLQADNVTVTDFFRLVANATELPFNVEGRFNKKGKHDWQIHYKYFEFMKTGLEDGFGIKVTKEMTKVPVYYVMEK